MRYNGRSIIKSGMQDTAMRRPTKVLVVGAMLVAGITVTSIVASKWLAREPKKEEVIQVVGRQAVPRVLEEKKEGGKTRTRYSDGRTTIEDEQTITTIFPDGEESTLFKVRQRGKGGEAIPAIEIE